MVILRSDLSSHILTKEEAEAYTKEKVLRGADGWAG